MDLSALKTAGVTAPVELLKRADVFCNLRSGGEAPARIVLVNLVENAALLQAIEGVETALSDMGLREGADFVLKSYCAQGDLSQLSQILDRVRMDRPDVLVTVSTPVLIAAVKRNLDCPIVFTVASDPEELGLFQDGRMKNVCGVHDDPRLDLVLEMARESDPGLACVGTVYDPSQMNALISVQRLRKACRAQGVRLIEANAATLSDLPLSTRTLIERGAGAVIVSADNLATTGFATIHRVADGAGVPIYVTNLALIEEGAAGGVGDSYFEWGRQSGRLLAKVLAGVPPGQLPIMPTEAQLRVNPKNKSRQTTTGYPLQEYAVENIDPQSRPGPEVRSEAQ